MDYARFGLLAICMGAVGCPSSEGGGNDTETDGGTSDTTGGPGGNTVTITGASASSTMSGSTTTDPATTDAPTDTSESESMTSPTSTTGDPPGMGCCEPHAGPGCNEPDVQTCVCKTLPECCVFEWDQPCVDAAMMDCMATCMGVDTGNETGPSDCELQQIELAAAEATLTGDWYVTMSMIKGVEIAAVNPPGDGSAAFTVPIPCMDTWHVWVRSIDAGSADSYFVTLDAEPDPPAIFEVDCTEEPFQAEYRWTQLNWRDNADPMNPGMPCEYVEDPWTADWDEGDHTIEFTFRDAYALSRVIVTNDPDFVPE